MHHKILFTLLATAAALPAGAWEPNLSDTSRVYDLDEIQIVRQSKEQYRLRQQPISSSMYSSIDLQNLGTRDLRELSSYVPNFVMPDYGSRYTSSIYVRGLGSRVNAPAVGIYVDGMPLMSKSAYNFHSTTCHVLISYVVHKERSMDSTLKAEWCVSTQKIQ